MPTPNVSIYHDTRRKKVSGLFPVKLRVYYDGARRDYGIYPDKDKETVLDLSKEDFQSVMYSQRPRAEQKALRDKINAVQLRAKDIAEKMGLFSFDAFERRYTGITGKDNDVIYQYNRYIKQLEKEERFGTARSYIQSLSSLLAFYKYENGKEAVTLPFQTITPHWLEEYEKYMYSQQYSKATIGIYLRPLRAIFNYAIAPVDSVEKRRLEPIIDREIYPFGRGLYVVPTASKVKKALKMEQLKKLFTHPVEPGSDQEKARDFFFFSYVGNGMNMRDIALLKRKNIQEDIIVFTREKTVKTTKAEPLPIVVPITEHIDYVIKKYGNEDTGPDSYVFPIMNDSMSAKERYVSVMVFIKFINQYIKQIAKAVGVTEDISSNWGRHSFTTNAVNNGAPMSMIQESLGHKNLKTTQIYFAGFTNNAKADIAKGLMNFNTDNTND